MKKGILFVLALAMSLLLSGIASAPVHAQGSLALSKYHAGLHAYDKGDYQEALRLFREVEAMAANIKHTPYDSAYLQYSIAESLRSVGEYKDAEEAFKKAFALMDEVPKKKQNYVFLLNGMGMLHQAAGRYREAEATWLQSESLANKHDYATRLFPVNNLTRHYFLWGKAVEMEQYLPKCEEIAKNAPKSTGVPYYELNLAQHDELKGNYAKAEQEYLQALKSCALMAGVDHQYTGFIMVQLSELYRKRSNFGAAERALLEAQKIFEKINPNHPDVAEVTMRLARVYADQGKYTKAKELANKALKMGEIICGTNDNLFVARARQCLGNIYRQDGRYAEAKQMLEQALAAQEKILGPNNVDVAIAKRDLAKVEADEANYREAETLMQASLATIDRYTGLDHPERAAALNALAYAYMRDGKYADAEPLLKQALQLAERVLGPTSLVTGESARDLGELYLKQKQFIEAQQYLQQSLTVDEKLYGESAPQVAADLMSLANAYAAQGNSAKAEELLKRAAQIKNVLPGAKSDDMDSPTASPITTADRPVTDKWALVVGISSFKDSSINLKFAAKDATDLKNFLVNHENFAPDHVKLLTDENATRENIMGMLGDKWLSTRVKPDDLVVVYVSSHGSAASDSAGGTNFLVAYDTNKNSLAATGIPMQWLTNIITEQVHSNRVVLILDVCHSGSAGEGSKNLVRTAGLDHRTLKIGQGQMVLCSSRSDQVSWESKNYENSVFTRRLIEALQTDKDKTTMLQAYKLLRVLVESEVLRDRGNLQTPLLVNKNWLGKDPVLSIEPLKAKQAQK